MFILSPANVLTCWSSRVGTKGASCGAVFVLFYYDITLSRAVSGVIIPIMSCNKMSALPSLPHSHGLIHCPHCRWKALDDEARKPFVEEADRLRQLHQKVVLEERRRWLTDMFPLSGVSRLQVQTSEEDEGIPRLSSVWVRSSLSWQQVTKDEAGLPQAPVWCEAREAGAEQQYDWDEHYPPPEDCYDCWGAGNVLLMPRPELLQLHSLY